MSDDDALIDESLEESLDDLGLLNNWAAGAVLWSTDWTAETIISQLRRNNIDLNPTFQRRSAWTNTKQSLFIESLILGLPIPQLILAESPTRRGSFIVIDGKQRLLAIRRFGTLEEDPDFRPLKLSGLNELKRLNGRTLKQMTDSADLSEDLAAFENSNIRTIVIRNWQSEEYLYEVFLRINTGSVQLSPQELRQALHPGPFSAFIGEASAESEDLQQALNLNAPDFRMRDAEILLRFIAYKNFINDYNGNLKWFLDETTRRLGTAWDQRKDGIRQQVKEMNEALRFTKETFGEADYLRKWNSGRFETRKNRAVFDIMLHYFSEAEVRRALVGKAEQVKLAFVDKCKDDTFRASLESTTKSMEANRIRFNQWGDAVAALSGVDVSALKFPG